MSGDDGEFQPRAGTYADLARRMDRQEERHEDLAKEVAGLTATMGQVVQNQKHAEELNELRFKAQNTAVSQLDTHITDVAHDLKGFMLRIDGIISGEVETVQTRQGQAIIADFMSWRKGVDSRVDVLEDAAERRGGVMDALRGGKGLVLMLCAIFSPIVAAVGIIITRPPG